MPRWSDDEIRTLKKRYPDKDTTITELEALFGRKWGSIRKKAHLEGLERKGKGDHILQGKAESKRRKILSKEDLAHRLMTLQGLEIKKITHAQVFEDEQLLAWLPEDGDIGAFQKFCRDLLILSGGFLEMQSYQLDMVRIWEENRYSIACCGRQIGKSLTVAAYTLWKCITVPNYFTAIISPSDRQSKELFNRIITFCAYNDQLYDSVVNPRADEVSFTNGSRIVSLPGRGSITGYTGLDVVIIDEASLPELPDKVYADAVPMLLAKHGKLILLGTPKGKTSRFYEYWNNRLFKRFHVPTSENEKLPDLDKFLEAEKRRCSVLEFNQEYLGIFQDLEGSFIPSRYIDAAVEDYDYVLQKNLEKVYYCGVDWGRFSDQSVVIVVSTFGEEVKVEHCKAFSNEPLQKCRAHVDYLEKVFNFALIGPEYNGLSIPIVDEMMSSPKVEPFTTTNESKFEAYSHLRKLFEDGRITLPAQETRLITQLRYLEMSQTPTGKTRIAHQSGKHDDYCDALMLACWGFSVARYDVGVDWEALLVE